MNSYVRLQEVYNLLSDINGEAQLQFNVDEIKVVYVDPAHTHAVINAVGKEGLLEYNLNEEDKERRLVIDVKLLKKILRKARAKQNDIVEMVLVDGGLSIKVGNFEWVMEEIVVEWSDLEKELPRLEGLESFSVYSKDLLKALDYVMFFADNIKMVVSPHSVVLASVDTKHTVRNPKYTIHTKTSIANDENKVTVYLTAELMKTIVSELDQVLSVQVKKDYPVFVYFSDSDSFFNGYRILAPRIAPEGEEEDDTKKDIENKQVGNDDEGQRAEGVENEASEDNEESERKEEKEYEDDERDTMEEKEYEDDERDTMEEKEYEDDERDTMEWVSGAT